jgi:hypothetical protein
MSLPIYTVYKLTFVVEDACRSEHRYRASDMKFFYQTLINFHQLSILTKAKVILMFVAAPHYVVRYGGRIHSL